jgi:EAL and modified HD-GYP domain-containing signal transduction protein
MAIFVARQPIFDTDHRVVGYELLHRGGEGSGELGLEFQPSSPEAEGVLDPAMKDLVGGKAAFVDFSRETLLDLDPGDLDPGRVIIQVQGEIAPDDGVVTACQNLASQGFRFAMGDSVLHEKHARLLRLAEVVKVNVQESVAEEKVALMEKLGDFKGKLLAEGVENQTTHEYCKALGFDFFQGFHYVRPETLTNKDLPTQSVSVVRILNLLRDPRATDLAIQEAFRSDPSLSYQLLQIVNSAALGGRGIDSISHAMRMLGREPLYRWLSLLLLADGKDRREVRTEIVRSSLTRGRMCELLGDGCRGPVASNLPAADTLFLVGLFSQLDTLLQVSMEDILSSIDLAGEAVDALLGREGQAGSILSAVEGYEEADWDSAQDRIAALGADPELLSNVYLDSITWASNRMDRTQD